MKHTWLHASGPFHVVPYGPPPAILRLHGDTRHLLPAWLYVQCRTGAWVNGRTNGSSSCCYFTKTSPEINLLCRTNNTYMYNINKNNTLADPGGRTPLTAADLWFVYAQNANFSYVFLRSLRSRFILSIIIIDVWSKHTKKTSTVNTFNDFLPPLDKVHAPEGQILDPPLQYTWQLNI